MRKPDYINQSTDVAHFMSVMRVAFMQKVKDKGIKNFYVHYHHPCTDGTAALYSTVNGLKTMFKEDINIIPVPAQYHGDVNLNHGQDSCLVVVDFAYAPLHLAEADVGLTVLLDHHESSVNLYKKFAGAFNDDTIIIFSDDNTMSGGGLAWRFFNRENIPHLIAAIEKRDLWDKNYLFVEEAYLFAAKHDTPSRFDVWDKAISSREAMVSLLSEFTPLVEKHQETCGIIAKEATIKQLAYLQIKGQYVCPVTGAGGTFKEPPATVTSMTRSFAIVNCHPIFISDVGSILNKNVNIAIMFHVLGPNSVKVSFRSAPKDSTAILQIVKYYQGGGHATAASCVMSMNQFLDFYRLNFGEPQPLPVQPTTVYTPPPLLTRIKEWIFGN